VRSEGDGGEAEYSHPGTPQSSATLMSGPEHWRSWLPASCYCTHSMGPVMMVTGTRPVQVNGFMVTETYRDDDWNPDPARRRGHSRL